MAEDRVLAEKFEQVKTALGRALNLEQTTGSADDKIMSQKAVSDNISGFHEKYTVSAGTAWILVNDVYKQTITVPGIKAANDYICGLVSSSIQSSAIAQEEAFCHVNSITIDDDSVTLTAFPPAPGTAFNLLILR